MEINKWNQSMSRINAIGAIKSIPTQKLSDLIVGDKYPVLSLKTMKTKYGDRLIVVTTEGMGEFQVYLPQRFNDKLSKQDKEFLLNESEHLSFIYKGKKKVGNYSNEAHDIEFVDSRWEMDWA